MKVFIFAFILSLSHLVVANDYYCALEMHAFKGNHTTPEVYDIKKINFVQNKSEFLEVKYEENMRRFVATVKLENDGRISADVYNSYFNQHYKSENILDHKLSFHENSASGFFLDLYCQENGVLPYRPYVVRKAIECEGHDLELINDKLKIEALPTSSKPYSSHSVTFYSANGVKETFSTNANCQLLNGGKLDFYCIGQSGDGKNFMIKPWRGDIYNPEVGWMHSPCGKDLHGNDRFCIALNNPKKPLMTPTSCSTKMVEIKKIEFY